MAFATLTWLPSVGATGYKIYAGRASLAYTAPGSPKDVGNVTTGTFDLLGANGVWYFAISAYNALGESGPGPQLTASFDEVSAATVSVTGVAPTRLVNTRLTPPGMRRSA